jgi:acyl dehydratase
MTIDYQKLLNWDIPTVEQTISKRDVILYALGVGLGLDPCDTRQLRFVYEAELRVLPTMAVILCYPGQWHSAPGTGITPSRVVQGFQGFEIHKPIPTECVVEGKTRVSGVYDMGEGKGALITTECLVRDKESGEPLCTIRSSHFCRGDGGFGGTKPPALTVPIASTRPPDATCELKTLPQAALIYRLSGDYNPLHADPKAAGRAGFPMPILHGRCTFGVAGHALLRTIYDYDPEKLKSMQVRFVAPVYPGETIRLEAWKEPHEIRFRALAVERRQIVLDHGKACATVGGEFVV